MVSNVFLLRKLRRRHHPQRVQFAGKHLLGFIVVCDMVQGLLYADSTAFLVGPDTIVTEESIPAHVAQGHHHR